MADLILHPRGELPRAAVKGLITMVNSIYNSLRFEGVWLEQRGSSEPRP